MMVRLGLLKLVVCFLAFAATTVPASMLSAQELTVKYAAHDFKGSPKFTVRAFKNGSFRAVWRSKTITAEGGLDTTRFGSDRNRLKWQNVSFQIPPNLGIDYFTIKFLNDECCGATRGGKTYGDRNFFVQKITFNRKNYSASRGKQKTCKDDRNKAGEMFCAGTLEIAVKNNTDPDTNAQAVSNASLAKSVCGYNFSGGKSASYLKSIQRGLAKRNLYSGGIDGKFGKGSCSALTKWAKCENVGSKVLSDGALSKLTKTEPSARELSCYGDRPAKTTQPVILSVNSSDDYRTEKGRHTIINVKMRNRWGNRAEFKLNGYVTGTKPHEVCLVYGNRNSDNKCFEVYDSNNTIKKIIAMFNKRDKENITDACSLIVTQFNKIRDKTKNINSRRLVDQRKSAFTGFAHKCLVAIQSSLPGTRYAAAAVGLVAPTLEGSSTPDQVTSGASCTQSKLQVRFNQNVLKSLDLYTSTVDGVSGPNYRKAVAGGEKLIGQWADAKKDCLGVIERKILEAVVAARKRGSSCEYLPNSTEIKNRFNGLKSAGVTDKAKLDHEKASGLIWMIETVSELEMRLSFLNFYSSRNSSMRDCRLSNKELKALETKPVEPKPVVVAKAPTCEDDPALCSIVQLCGKAASTVNGDRAWNTDAKAADYVALAKSSGVTCGVKPKPVVVAKAPTCEDDPALCSIVQLCGKAASTVNGDRAWNTDAKAADYVALAKSSGVTCGVKPKPVVVAKAPTCEDDPTKCSVIELCQQATGMNTSGEKFWRMDAALQAYVDTAKSTGVTCGVVSKVIETAKLETCENTPSKCSLAELCQRAISFETGKLGWTTTINGAPYVQFAKNSGMTCGVQENLVAAVPEQKQVEPPAPKKVLKYTNRKALVIGNANYVDQTPLKNPINDAKAVAAKLEQIGFEVTYKENLEYREFGRTLGDFEREVASSDVSLIYYAGHGIEVDSVNYLIPVDAELSNPSDVKFETVMLEDAVRASLNTGKLSMVLVDACRDNPFAKSMIGGSRSVGRGLSIVDAQPGKIDQIISFAAESGEVAEDGTGNNSPYATSLLELLDEPNLEVGKLFRKLGDNVERMTNGKQIPVTRNRLSGEDIYLVVE